LTKGRISTVTR